MTVCNLFPMDIVVYLVTQNCTCLTKWEFDVHFSTNTSAIQCIYDNKAQSSGSQPLYTLHPHLPLL